LAEQVAMLDDKLQGQVVEFENYLVSYLSCVSAEELQCKRLLNLL
jgi:hypothetical protein